jgi:hypothetical protein
MPTTDIVQRTSEAVVAMLDTAPDIVALTSRANGNVIPFDDLADAALPVIAYIDVTSAIAGGIGDTRRVILQFTAAGSTKAVVNALLEAVENNLTTTKFYAAGLDAYMQDFLRRGTPGDTEEGYFSADMDVTLIVTK